MVEKNNQKYMYGLSNIKNCQTYFEIHVENPLHQNYPSTLDESEQEIIKNFEELYAPKYKIPKK